MNDRQNLFRRTYDVVLHDDGTHSITEFTEYFGSHASNLRQQHLTIGDRELRSATKAAAQNRMQTSEVTELQWSSIRDLSVPMTLTVNCRESSLVESSLLQDTITVTPALVFQALPEQVLDLRPWMSTDEAASLKTQPEAVTHSLSEQKQVPRRHDLAIQHPMLVECVWRVHGRSGFAVPPPQAPLSIRIGSSFAESEVRAISGEPWTITFRCSSGTEPLNPEELREWQQRLTEFNAAMEKAPLQFMFRHPADVLLAKDDQAAALKMLHKDHIESPDEVVRRLRYIELLAKVGFAEPAQQLAESTLVLAPESAHVCRVAASAFQSTLFNGGPVSDQNVTRSIALLRRSLELEPNNLTAKVQLAVQLHVKPDETLRGSQSQREAAALLRPHVGTFVEQFQIVVANCLFFSEQFGELKAMCQELGPVEGLRPLKVAAVSKLDGPAAAIAELKREVDEEQLLPILLEAMNLLNAQRDYRAVGELIAEINRFSRAAREPHEEQLTVTSKLLTRLQTYEEALLPESDPQGVAQRLLVNLLAGEELCGPSRDMIHHADLRADEMLTALKAAFQEREFRGESAERRADQISLFRLKVESAKGIGHYVNCDSPYATLRLVIAEREGRLKILASSLNVEHLGDEALELLDKRNLPAARQMMTWAHASVVRFVPNKRTSADQFTFPQLELLWSEHHQNNADAARTRLAALSIATLETGTDPIPFLNDLRRRSRQPEQIQIDRTTVRWLKAQDKHREAIAAVDRLLRFREAGDAYWKTRFKLLMADRQFAQAKVFAQARTRSQPESAAPLLCLAEASSALGEHDVAAQALKQAIGKRGITEQDLNRLAWNSVVNGKCTPDSYEQALHAVFMSGRKDPEILHTLATVCAQLDQSSEAIQIMTECRQLQLDGSETADDNYFVAGRIAESMELIETARFYYDLASSSAPDTASDSSAALAARRLTDLNRTAVDTSRPATRKF